MLTKRIDHLVLTVADIERTVEFFRSVMGMTRVEFRAGRIALCFGPLQGARRQPDRDLELYRRVKEQLC